MELMEQEKWKRLEQQIRFIKEIDKLKQVWRQNHVLHEDRPENDAEHMWHLAVMAVILLEHANEPDLDLLRVLKMLIIHDVVEIDAGDTFAYDDAGHLDKREREERAAERIFGLLPPDQRQEFLGLWQEFEDQTSKEAKFALALDRFHPMLLNYTNKGNTWQRHGITFDRVIKRNEVIAEGSAPIWEYAKRMVDDAVDKGYLEI